MNIIIVVWHLRKKPLGDDVSVDFQLGEADIRAICDIGNSSKAGVEICDNLHGLCWRLMLN